MPIDVCVGDYCWDGKRVCGHFDNEGGHGNCDLGMDVDSDKTGYYPKPKECLELKQAENVKKCPNCGGKNADIVVMCQFCRYKFKKPKRGKCPCGGYYQDWHSHASDCIALGGNVDYEKKRTTKRS